MNNTLHKILSALLSSTVFFLVVLFISIWIKMEIDFILALSAGNFIAQLLVNFMKKA